MTTTEYIDGQAGRLALHRFPSDGDATILLCHATGFAGRVYQALGAELANDGAVTALDFRGHGDSDTPSDADDLAWSSLTDDLLAVVDHLGEPQLHGFGHSLGGAVMLDAERRRPGMFTSMFAFEPMVLPDDFVGDNSSMSTTALRRRRSFPTTAEALLRYAKTPPLSLLRADILSDYVTHAFTEATEGVTLKCTPETESSIFAHAGSISLGQMVHIDRHVTVAQSGDGQLPAQLAAAVADALPKGELLSFPTITHMGPLQDPVSVADAVRRLMTRAQAPQTGNPVAG